MTNKLKKAREEAGFSQEELAEKSGISRTTISTIENMSDFEDVTVKSSTLITLAKTLNKSIAEIFF